MPELVGDLDAKIAEALAPLRPQLETLLARRVAAEVGRLVAEMVGAELTRLDGEQHPRPALAAADEAGAALKRCATCKRELPRSAFDRHRSPRDGLRRDFAAATGLRPEEWAALERRDLDRRAGLVNVRRTVSDGQVVELAKTSRSRRQVPLTRRALEALEWLAPRLETPLLFPSPRGRLLDLHNFSRREWAPAVEASGVAKPARVYDLRSTFASNALAAGVTVFELARIMGTSVLMIERHYGALLDGAQAGIAGRLDALEAELEQANTREVLS